MKPLKDLQSQETKDLKTKIQLPNIATVKIDLHAGKAATQPLQKQDEFQ